MIELNTDEVESELREMISRFQELPRHIARKHLQASMNRAIKPGVPILKANTPPIGVSRGRRKKGEKRSTGAMRKAVATKSKMTANWNVYGILGYRAGFESRKAIWHEFGTVKMAARRMMEATLSSFAGPTAQTLADEMATGLEKAANELASGQNPGRKP